MKRNYKIMSSGGRETVLPQLSDDDINKLYKEYSAMDGKHKNFKGTKREYCATVAGLIERFLNGNKKNLEGSGKKRDAFATLKSDLKHAMRDRNNRYIKTFYEKLQDEKATYNAYKSDTYRKRAIDTLNLEIGGLTRAKAEQKAIIEKTTSDRVKKEAENKIVNYGLQVIEKNLKRVNYLGTVSLDDVEKGLSKELKIDNIKLNERLDLILKDQTIDKKTKYYAILQLYKDKYKPYDIILGPTLDKTQKVLDKNYSEIENLVRRIIQIEPNRTVTEDDDGSTLDEPRQIPGSVSIPHVVHNKETGERVTQPVPKKIKLNIFNYSATDRASDVTIERLIRYARQYKNVIKAFVSNDVALSNFLLAVQYEHLTDLTDEGYAERRAFSDKLTIKGLSQTKGVWGEVEEAAFRTEYLVYKKLLAGRDLSNDWYKLFKYNPDDEISDERELRFILLGKLFSKELGYQILDFPFEKVLIELKGKKLLKSTSTGEHGGIQVDVKKIAQLILESYRDPLNNEPRDIPTLAKCLFIEYTGDRHLLNFELNQDGTEKRSKFFVEAVVEFDITKMIKDKRCIPYLKSIKDQLELYCNLGSTSKIRGGISNRSDVEDAIFTMMRVYFADGVSPLPRGQVGNVKQAEKAKSKRLTEGDTQDLTVNLNIANPNVQNKLTIAAYSPTFFEPIMDELGKTAVNYKPTVKDYSVLWKNGNDAIEDSREAFQTMGGDNLVVNPKYSLEEQEDVLRVGELREGDIVYSTKQEVEALSREKKAAIEEHAGSFYDKMSAPQLKEYVKYLKFSKGTDLKKKLPTGIKDLKNFINDFYTENPEYPIPPTKEFAFETANFDMRRYILATELQNDKDLPKFKISKGKKVEKMPIEIFKTIKSGKLLKPTVANIEKAEQKIKKDIPKPIMPRISVPTAVRRSTRVEASEYDKEFNKLSKKTGNDYQRNIGYIRAFQKLNPDQGSEEDIPVEPDEVFELYEFMRDSHEAYPKPSVMDQLNAAKEMFPLTAISSGVAATVDDDVQTSSEDESSDDEAKQMKASGKPKKAYKKKVIKYY